MNLFFETENQARVFISAVPLGFFMAAAFSLLGRAGRFRVLLDVLCLVLCGLSVAALVVITRDDGLRLYHLLALCVGAILYLLGVHRLLLFCRHILQKR